MKPTDRTLRSNRQRYQIWKAQNGLCTICGEPLSDKFEIDHDRPFSKGGETVYYNLKATHRRCNRKKGAQYECVAFCEVVAGK
jgi:5-methylcytosine-specific restriction endonuclease McrA